MSNNKSFLRNVATLSGGSVLAQIITLAFSPLLTRLYTPQEFGQLALYVVLMSNFAVIATARYEFAIVLPAKQRCADNLMALSILICISLSLFLLVLTPWRVWFAELAGQKSISDWLLLFPFSVLLAGLMQTYSSWNNRQQLYSYNAGARIAQSITNVSVQALAALAGLGALGLLLGQFLGQLSALILQAWQDIKHGCPWRKNISRKEIKQAANLYREFPCINTPHAFSTALQDTLTITIITVLSGSLTVGLYGLMIRVLKLPVYLVGQSIAQVTYRDMAAAKHNGQALMPIYKKTILFLLPLATIPACILFFFAQPLFALVFGESWKLAGSMASALSPYMFCHFIVSPIGIIPLVINRQKTSFIFTLCGNFIFLSSLIVGFYLWNNIISALWLVSGVMSVYFATYFFWIYKAIKQYKYNNVT